MADIRKTLSYRALSSEPLSMISNIVKDRVYESRYWKERCFALNAETILDRAKALDCIGTTFGGFNRPTHFLCLLVKLLQIQPEIEIVQAYLDHSAGAASNDMHIQTCDLRYMRVLAAVYARLICNSETVYCLLEPLLQDYRTLNVLTSNSSYSRITIDQLIEKLIFVDIESPFDMIFPFILKRPTLVKRGVLRPFESILDLEG